MLGGMEMKFSTCAKIVASLAVFLVVLTSSAWTATAAEEILTVSNNKDLATLLVSGGRVSEAFVAKYKGRTIRFDGCVLAKSRHGDYGRHSRYDFFIYAWDYDEDDTNGSPNMILDSVGLEHAKFVRDLAWIRDGTNLRITARVVKWDTKYGRIVLKPVSLEER